ncbi:MAG: ABC transporter substrate-binding protein [Streptosporangiales bacterium]|nr:ABC transporter substrate-binding protein [Streptosporangiales bacterium]
MKRVEACMVGRRGFPPVAPAPRVVPNRPGRGSACRRPGPTLLAVRWIRGRRRRAAALLTAASLAASAVVACSSTGGGSDGADGRPDELTVYAGRGPQLLIPGAVGDAAGLQMVSALFTGLVRYDPLTARPVNAVAASIASEDQKTWTIELKPGWRFHNGEPVTARSFADAWNATAYGPNGWAGNKFFAGFAGYRELNPGSEDPEPENAERDEKPDRRTLSGVEVVDETTLRVTLRAPFSQFPLILGYPAFFPLPSAAIEDPGRYGRAPVGNGPYRLVGTHEAGRALTVTRFDGYPGSKPPVRTVTFTAHASADAAYRSLLAGRVDLMPLPPELVADARRRLGGGRVVDRPGSTLQYLGLPLYDKRFRDPRLRRALSMAIDREGIAGGLLAGTYAPARSLVAPVTMGARPDPCGATCTYDPAGARRLLEEAGGWDGTLYLWFNPGSGHEAWIRAVADQLRRNLGITDIQVKEPDFDLYKRLLAAREVDGLWRQAWLMDYPSAQDYLQPLYASDGAYNYSGYADDEVDRLIAAGNAAGSLEESLTHYRQAEDALLDDLPVIPLWFERLQFASSARVSSVGVDAFGVIQLDQVVPAPAN